MTAYNLVSSPGSGKTTLLCATLRALRLHAPALGLAVIEGDQQTSRDADRVRATGVEAVQVNTGKGCHLDARMVGEAFGQLALHGGHGHGDGDGDGHGHDHGHDESGALLFIENVGNLVCPALWDLGEAAKIAILSVTEGDDKPLKYPDMFAAARLMVIAKTDLLPHVDFDMADCVEHARRVHPDIEVLAVSAKTGEGMQAWLDWLLRTLDGGDAGAAKARAALDAQAPRAASAKSTHAALPLAAPARVLACGAHLKNTACVVDGRSLRWSPLHGDLSQAASCEALERSVDRLLRDGAEVDAVAHDLHPDFHSTRLALAVAERLGVPAVAVQHHHAHVAAVMAERGIVAPVIGIALDGVGLGSDGTAWGGEVLWVDGAPHRWRRMAHLAPIALAGGDVAAREPWRLAAAVLHASGRGRLVEGRYASAVGAAAARTVAAMLDRGIHCPPSTAAGRWFDAAAGALGLSVRQGAEAEAAVALERRATAWLAAHPDFDASWPSLDFAPLVDRLCDVDPADEVAVDCGAALFHLSLADALAGAAVAAASETAAGEVVFGGGCFANRLLADRLAAQLPSAGLRVHTPHAVPCGDAGLALGQAWIAAHTLAAGAVAAPAAVAEAS